MNNSESVHIQQHRTNHSTSLGEVIRQLCQTHPPSLAWAEPRIGLLRIDPAHPTPGRHPNFIPLVSGTPDWPIDQPLAEARLFWPDRAIHLLAQGDQACTSVTLSENTNGESTLKQRLRLLTLRDAARFGLNRVSDPQLNLISAIEYRKNGRLLAWRLVETHTSEEASHV
jgi:hypothetical protein